MVVCNATIFIKTTILKSLPKIFITTTILKALLKVLTKRKIHFFFNFKEIIHTKIQDGKNKY